MITGKGVNQRQREINHSTSSNSYVKNEYNCSFTPRMAAPPPPPTTTTTTTTTTTSTTNTTTSTINSNNSNSNNNNRSRLKITHTIPQQHNGKGRNQETTKRATLGTANALRKVLLWEYKTYLTCEITLHVT